MAKSRAKPVPPGGEDHPARRRRPRIPPSKEVQKQMEENWDPKTGRHKGALRPPGMSGLDRPLIPMPWAPLGGYRNDRTPWNQPGVGGEMWNTVITRRNKNLWGFLK